MVMHLSDDIARGEDATPPRCRLEEVGRLPGLIRLRCDGCGYAAFLIPAPTEIETAKLIQAAIEMHDN